MSLVYSWQLSFPTVTHTQIYATFVTFYTRTRISLWYREAVTLSVHYDMEYRSHIISHMYHVQHHTIQVQFVLLTNKKLFTDAKCAISLRFSVCSLFLCIFFCSFFYP